jgi:hypothetical protein
MTRAHGATLVLCLLAISALAARQAPGVTAPPTQASPLPRPNTVFLSGENPVVFLYDRPGGDAETFVSFWRVHWSPVGPGHVCYVTTGKEGTKGALRLALHDNARLLDYLTNQVLGTFNRAYIDRPFTAIAGATFAKGGDQVREHRETCRSDRYTVELTWRELKPAGLIDILPGSRPTNPFGITYLRIPAGQAAVTINAAPAPGVSVADASFLAFGETWIK